MFLLFLLRLNIRATPTGGSGRRRRFFSFCFQRFQNRHGCFHLLVLVRLPPVFQAFHDRRLPRYFAVDGGGFIIEVVVFFPFKDDGIGIGIG